MPRNASDGFLVRRLQQGPLPPVARMPVQRPRPESPVLQAPERAEALHRSQPLIPHPSQAQSLLHEVRDVVNDFCGTLCQHVQQPYQFVFIARPALLRDRILIVEVYKYFAHTIDYMTRILRVAEAEIQSILDIGSAFVQSLKKLLGLLQHNGAGSSAHSQVTGRKMLDFLLNSSHK
ncbi:unnamed protein product [Ixodes hexagonus]